MGEEASSSSSSDSDGCNMHNNMPSPEGPVNLMVCANDMQLAQWPVSADSISPPWESDSALTVPIASNVNTDLDMYGSGVSSGKACCVSSTTFLFVYCLLCNIICVSFACCSGCLLVEPAELFPGVASGF